MLDQRSGQKINNNNKDTMDNIILDTLCKRTIIKTGTPVISSTWWRWLPKFIYYLQGNATTSTRLVDLHVTEVKFSQATPWNIKTERDALDNVVDRQNNEGGRLTPGAATHLAFGYAIKIYISTRTSMQIRAKFQGSWRRGSPLNPPPRFSEQK